MDHVIVCEALSNSSSIEDCDSVKLVMVHSQTVTISVFDVVMLVSLSLDRVRVTVQTPNGVENTVSDCPFGCTRDELSDDSE